MYPLITQVIYTVVIRYIDGYTVEKPVAKKLDPINFFYSSTSRPYKIMAHQTRDNPDPQNIIPDDKKQKQNATDCAQGLDPYFRTVEATTKPREAQG